ncbi:UNVERIFIED_CONTAM: hypothetical protein GTU68_037210 [Idotea baltica]|nr:hypothetical protein [Idotea baltica]
MLRDETIFPRLRAAVGGGLLGTMLHKLCVIHSRTIPVRNLTHSLRAVTLPMICHPGGGLRSVNCQEKLRLWATSNHRKPSK